MSPIEIERSWIINPYKLTKNKPKWIQLNIIGYAEHRIGYIISNNDGELRVVEKDSFPHPQHFITVKDAGDLSRNEYERLIPEWAFKLLWEQTEGKRVYKTRHYIRSYFPKPEEDKEIILELDEYINEKGISYFYRLECEFDSIEDASKFLLPQELIDCSYEVTHDKRFKNRNIAINGLPKGWREFFRKEDE